MRWPPPHDGAQGVDPRGRGRSSAAVTRDGDLPRADRGHCGRALRPADTGVTSASTSADKRAERALRGRSRLPRLPRRLGGDGNPVRSQLPAGQVAFLDCCAPQVVVPRQADSRTGCAAARRVPVNGGCGERGSGSRRARTSRRPEHSSPRTWPLDRHARQPVHRRHRWRTTRSAHPCGPPSRRTSPSVAGIPAVRSRSALRYSWGHSTSSR